MSVFEDRFRKRTIEHVTLPEGGSRAAARSQMTPTRSNGYEKTCCRRSPRAWR